MKRSRRKVVSEIGLEGASPRSGLLRRWVRKLWKSAAKRRVTAGALLITEEALVVEARAEFRGRLEISWDSVRKAAVDDGDCWGHVSGVCRFPVYDHRADGSGSGALIGPLWGQGSSLMPAGCAVTALDPVPGQPPNVALVFEPLVSGPPTRKQNGSQGRDASIVCLLLRTDDTDAARDALASRTEVGHIDRDDLQYLSGGSSNSGDGASSSP